MGWAGTLRSLQAAARRAEREAKRRDRENFRLEREAQRAAELENAFEDYTAYVEEIEALISVHTECSLPFNWEAFLHASGPQTPTRMDYWEALAREDLDEYTPNLLERLFRREDKKRRQLEQGVDEGRALDDKKFHEAQQSYEQQERDFARRKSIAEGIFAGDAQAFVEAMREADPFSANSHLGSSVAFKIDAPWYAQASVRVHREDVIPSQDKRLLSSGKLSVKQMPQGRFYELYQDHVCSCVLRVARELFAILPPLRMVFVHAESELLNTQTGYKEEQPILSVAIPRENLAQLNFEAIDCSDRGMHLTPETPTYSMRGCGGLPADAGGV